MTDKTISMPITRALSLSNPASASWSGSNHSGEYTLGGVLVSLKFLSYTTWILNFYFESLIICAECHRIYDYFDRHLDVCFPFKWCAQSRLNPIGRVDTRMPNEIIIEVGIGSIGGRNVKLLTHWHAIIIIVQLHYIRCETDDFTTLVRVASRRVASRHVASRRLSLRGVSSKRITSSVIRGSGELCRNMWLPAGRRATY